MSTVNDKHPPEFILGDSYKAWKNKLKMWDAICGIEKKDQALFVRLKSFKQYKAAERACESLEVGKAECRYWHSSSSELSRQCISRRTR